MPWLVVHKLNRIYVPPPFVSSIACRATTIPLPALLAANVVTSVLSVTPGPCGCRVLTRHQYPTAQHTSAVGTTKRLVPSPDPFTGKVPGPGNRPAYLTMGNVTTGKLKDGVSAPRVMLVAANATGTTTGRGAAVPCPFGSLKQVCGTLRATSASGGVQRGSSGEHCHDVGFAPLACLQLPARLPARCASLLPTTCFVCPIVHAAKPLACLAVVCCAVCVHGEAVGMQNRMQDSHLQISDTHHALHWAEARQ